ncbi:LamG domain-containing protein, partial [bacterium]|nr:LamG domain-containing protein [bacterium]
MNSFTQLTTFEKQLIDSYVDGTISPKDFADLENRLFEDAGFRAAMRSYLALDDNLTRIAESQAEENPWLAPAPKKSPFKIWPAALAACVAFALGLALMNWRTAPEAPPEVTTIESKAEGFAVIKHLISVEWPEGTTFREGDALSAETLHLESGTASIQFFSGATMTIEGPTEISLLSAWEATCHEGSVRMHVPPAARGFKLHSPSTEIIDLGTEFGLQVRDGEGHIEVFDGEIALTHRDEDEKILTKGGALHLAQDGPSTVSTSGQIAYPDANHLGSLTQRRLTSFQNWKTHRAALSQDPRLLGYYTFEEEINAGLLPNLISPTDSNANGSIILAEPVDGRWPGLKPALEFRRPGARVRVNIPGEFPAFTFVAWVRIDSLSHQYSALFMGDGYENGEPHWQIRDDGKLMFSVMVDETSQHPRFPKSRFHHVYLSPPVWDISKSGQWMHLASVYDPAKKSVSHFVDGQKVSSEEIADEFLVKTLRIGNGEIGNWGQPFRTDPTFA